MKKRSGSDEYWIDLLKRATLRKNSSLWVLRGLKAYHEYRIESVKLCNIVKNISIKTGFLVSEISLKTRKREVLEVRQLAHYVCRKHTKLSLEHIGYSIGEKDHATVINSIEVVQNLLDTDKIFRSKYDEIITEYNLK